MNTSSHIHDVTADDFSQRVVEASRNRPVLVDFWASWCAPCRMLAPVLEGLAAEYGGRFELAKVDTDEQVQLAADHGIRSLPTVRIFKNGTVVDEFYGALPEAEVRAYIERHLVHESDKLHAAAVQAYGQGDLDRAVTLWEQALAQPPVRPEMMTAVARAYIDKKDYEAAEEALKSLPIEMQVESQAAALRTLIALGRSADGAPDDETLLHDIAADPDDCEARYQYGARHILQGDYEPALEQMLEILRRRPAFRENAAQEAMVAVFALSDDQGDLVNRYRRRMFAALH